MSQFDAVELGIMWDRLISITDEMVSALVRTSFSLMVREVGDLSCVLFDAQGRSLAQGSFSQPAFTGTAPQTIRHMLQKFPAETLEPDDVLITNDPWMGTGHIFDVSLLRPVFRGAEHVGFTMSVSHLPDIGGLGFGTVATQIYEEGLYIPIIKIVEGGRVNTQLMEIIQGNVRLPEEVWGDLMGHITCNRVGERYLLEFMDEYGIDSLEPLSRSISSQTEKSMRARIEAIPDGVYKNRIQAEGYDEPLTLACAVNVSGDSVHIDFSGTGPAVPRGINVPLCYTRAFSFFSIKALTIPEIPNNEGATNPITISAPLGCLYNPQPPSPTGGRHIIGHFVTPLVFGALEAALPEQVQADCGMLSQVSVLGTHRDGRPVSTVYFASGGYGAHGGLDGAPVTPGPGNMIACASEIMERDTCVSVLHKALLPDSGGPGEFRGGVGQEVLLRNDTGHPLAISGLSGRSEFAPKGMRGGAAGALRQYRLQGQVIHPKGRYTMQPGDTLTMSESGGGGFGDPRARDPQDVLADVVNGDVSPEAALRDYDVVVDLAENSAHRPSSRRSAG